MTKSKIFAAAAALTLAAGALLSHSASAASFSIADILRGDAPRAEGIEMASAKMLDDNGKEASDSEADDHGAGHDGGESSDHGGSDHDSDHDSDHGGEGGDSDGGSDD